MAGRASLDKYREKRDFERTAEPAGGEKRSSKQPIFVVQKHDASRLHYDFRLEVAGVLKSWALPKGPSVDPRQRRLAVPTEDHPLEYADFEGVIPEGEYGAGTVLVWDRGTYRNLRAEKEGERSSMERSLQEGKIEVWLEGQKLKGGYALIRTGKPPDKRWLLIKKKDSEASPGQDPIRTRPESVITGRNLEEIAASEHRSR